MKKTNAFLNHAVLFSCYKGKKFITAIIIAVLSIFSSPLQSQIISWDASSHSGFGVSPWAPATLNSNLTINSTGLIRGTSISVSGTGPTSGCWGGSGGWGTTDAGSVYFSFKANAGYKVSLSSISSALRRSGSGPTTCNIEFSLNGGAYTTAGTWNISSTTGTTGTANSSTLSGFTALQNVAAGTVIRFRITFPGSPSANWYLTGGANSLKLNGTVVAVPSCTTPAGLAATNVGPNSADLSWNSITGVSGYEYTVSQTAAAPTGSGTATTTNSYSATGLNPGTVYYIHVRTNCGTSVFSNWASSSFTTSSSCATPTVSSVTSNGPVCANTKLQLQLTVAGTGPLSYTWTGAGNFNSMSVSNPTVTNAATGSYSVSVSNGCGTATAVISVVVNPLPAVSATSATICAGKSATLTAGGALTYVWNTSASTQSIVANPSVNTSYTVTGTDLNNCVNTATASVTVNALPVITANSATICTGTSAVLTAGGAMAYVWNTSASTQSIVVNPLANTSYTVTGKDINNCVNTVTTGVMVNVLPVITANSATICTGTSAALVAGGATSYTWSTAQTTQSISVSPTTSANYTVTGVDGNGCANSFTAQVKVNPMPVMSVNSSTICSGATATLIAWGVTTYTWSTGLTTSTLALSPLSTTTVSVSGYGPDCSAIVSNTAVVVVNTPTTLSFTPVNGPLCINHSSVALVAMPSGGAYTGTGVWGNSFNPALSGAGTFTLTYNFTNANNCFSSVNSTVVVGSCTGVGELAKQTPFSVYPNPAQDFVKVGFEDTDLHIIEIFNDLGMLVYTEQTMEHTATIDVSHFSNGLYMMKAGTSLSSSVVRFVKQ